MKQIMIALLFFSSFIVAQERVVVKQLVETENEDGTEVEVTVDDQEMRIEIEKDGKEEVYTVKLKNDLAVKELMDKLKSDGIDIDLFDLPQPEKINKSRGYLGVGLTDLTDQLKTYFGVKKGGGVLVNNVSEDSPAQKAGLRAGDIILIADDEEIEDSYELSRFVKRKGPDSRVSLTILRSGKQRKITAVLGETKMDWHYGPPPRSRMKGLAEDFDDLSDIYFFRGEPGMKHDKRKKFIIKQKEKALGQHADLEREMKELREEVEKLREELKKLKE